MPVTQLDTVPDNDPDLLALLSAEDLPVDDLSGDKKQYFGYRDSSDQLIAAGGLEICGRNAILRSCVVAPAHKGHQLGTKLIHHIVSRAKQNRLTRLYLLTETAPGFFETIGFQKIERDDVPHEVAQSAQFSEICPQTAIAMRLDLPASPDQD